MRILTRYLSVNVIASILIVLLVLTSLLLFVGFSQELSDIGTGNYNTIHAMLYVLMTLPAGIYQFFPIAGLLGSLIGIGILASRSELIVMRSAGISILKITWIILKAACLLMILALVLGEVAAPSLQRHAAAYKTEATSKGQAFHTSHGAWLHQRNAFIRIEKILSKHQLKNVTLYQFDATHNLIASTFAKSAVYENDHWFLQDVTKSQINTANITNIHYDKQQWDVKLQPKLLGVITIDSDARSLPQLYSYIKYLHYSGLRSQNEEFLFWQRIFQPLAALVMILLAIPFIFGPLRTVTMGLRILAGVTVGLGYFLINQFLGPLTIVYQLPAFAVALVPTLLVAMFGIIMLLRI